MRPLVNQNLTPSSITDSRRISKGFSPLLPTDTCKTDPDLAAVNAAWPTLPEAVRASIVMLVKAASK